MMNDINHLDYYDEGLKAIFGARFHGETQAPPKKPKPAPRDAQWEPQPHEPTQLERLKAAAKSLLLYAALSLLLFYFQQTGQMAMSASMPCIIVCVALGFFGAGKHFAGGKNG